MNTVIDVFCGSGGLTHGFVLEGMNVVAGFDFDESCAFAYEHNNDGAEFIHADIAELSPDDVAALFPEGSTKILVGCAPCQPFSRYTKGRPRREENWALLYAFAELIRAVRPDVVSMENVPELKSYDEGRVFRDFVDALEDVDYVVSDSIVYCPDYGVPQSRSRLVLFASQYGELEMIAPTHSPAEYVTVQDVIGELPLISAGQIYDDDLLHRACNLSELNAQRIAQSVPGGTWLDWDEDLRAACHTRETGTSYSAVYGRMRWDRPSPTITTQAHYYGSGRFGHPEQNRAITMREAALLQSFPPDYEFVPPGTRPQFKKVGRQIGNAVPVSLSRAIARSVSEHLRQYGIHE